MLTKLEKVNEKSIKGYILLRYQLKKIICNQKGDVTTVGILGWAALVITLIVLAHDKLNNWLPDFLKVKIFDRANTL
ncbi:MAG: hypothetical protein PHI90_10855 [Clostridia bacterium]|nr:hypothetical protein [Clostridia bacterium]MDD4049288.1 hypothetical protein [Clostridia bacterium]